jgi:hypothetical protein
MQFEEFGKQEGKTLLLLPGTACTWQLNFKNVVDELAGKYHIIAVNYDGFEGDPHVLFTDMSTVTEKIEGYILEKHGGRVDGAYGSSLGGSFVGLLVQRKRIHVAHAFIGSSDLDQGSPLVARIMTAIIGRMIGNAGKSEKSREKLKNLLTKAFGAGYADETEGFMDQFANSIAALHPKTVGREYYSDYVTPLEDDIHVDGTTVHVIYALKMGAKYEKRYLQHFRNPDLLRFDMAHEAWLFQKEWRQPVLDAIAGCMEKN